MNKTLIRNLILVFILISSLLLVCTISYSYISKQIIEDNINNNLTKILSTSSDSVLLKFDVDYNNYKQRIDNLTGSVTGDNKVNVVKEKLTILNNHRDEILYSSITNGFGGFIENNETGDYYLINDVKYQDLNESDRNTSKEYDVILADLGNDFKTGNGEVNEFSDPNDSIYIIYHIDDIIVYAKASEVLGPILSDMDLIEDYILINPDLGIRYSTTKTTKSVLSDYLVDQGNNYTSLQNLVFPQFESLSSTNPYILINNIKYHEKSCWMLVSNLVKEGTTNNLYLVMFVNENTSMSALKTVFSPLLATFLLVLIIVSLALVLTYYLTMKKTNDINLLGVKKYLDPVYSIRVKADGTIIGYSDSFKRVLADHAKYHNFKDFHFDEEYPNFLEALTRQRPFTLILDSEDTVSHLPMILSCSVLKYFNQFEIICLNTTDESSRTMRYRSIATEDSVTGNPNVEVLKEDIATTIANIKSGKEVFKASILEIYLSNFKNLRLFYGKYMGEQILIKINEAIKEIIESKIAKIYTIDSETLGILLNRIETYEDAEKVANDIVRTLKKSIEVDDNRLVVDGTVAIYNLDLETFPMDNPSVILEGLDRLTSMLQINKTKPIDTYTLAVEKYISSEEMLVADIRKAIQEKEFMMYLQPQYNIYEHRIESFELLIRWNNPKYINSSPAHFIEIAERNGLIVQIGKFVNEESMRIAKELEPYDLSFSLNVSPAQLIQTGFVAELKEITEKYQVDPAHISLEITETFLMENFEVTIEKLRDLKRYGFKIHLDDFGTGYSSLLYLKELPIDAIKIDKEFTKYITIDKFSRTVIQKVASLARTLDLGIICEGVEDEKQVAFLARNECDIIQGYIVSPAVSVDEAIKLIDEYNIKKTKIINEEKKKK